MHWLAGSRRATGEYAGGSADTDPTASATGDRKALRKVETCLKIFTMSGRGVYDQMTSEQGAGFTPEAAQYAVDNLPE